MIQWPAFRGTLIQDCTEYGMKCVMDELERQLILQVLDSSTTLQAAATTLGLERRALAHKLRKHGIPTPGAHQPGRTKIMSEHAAEMRKRFPDG